MQGVSQSWDEGYRDTWLGQLRQAFGREAGYFPTGKRTVDCLQSHFCVCAACQGRAVGILPNNYSLDDPLIWGFLPMRFFFNPNQMRWSLGSYDICFQGRYVVEWKILYISTDYLKLEKCPNHILQPRTGFTNPSPNLLRTRRPLPTNNTSMRSTPLRRSLHEAYASSSQLGIANQ